MTQNLEARQISALRLKIPASPLKEFSGHEKVVWFNPLQQRLDQIYFGQVSR
jgi:hypothetical protein